jgi:hypothetical protein
MGKFVGWLKHYKYIILTVLLWNLVNGYIIYTSVLHFEKAVWVYSAKPSSGDDYYMVKKPEDDWAIPGYLDP